MGLNLALGLRMNALGPVAPSWILPGASLDLDFANDRYYAEGGGTLSSLLACSRAGTGLAQRVDGSWTSFGNNVPRITDQGLLVEEARTNLVVRNTAYGHASWTAFISGTGTLPTITDNFAAAPDGTNTAARLQFNLNGGTTSADASGIQQTPAIVNGIDHTNSLWVKSTVGGSGNINCYTANGNPFTVPVTGAWTRVTNTVAANSTTGRARIALIGNTVSPVTDVLVWGAQLEVGSFATSPILTASTSVLRPADVTSLLVSALAAALAARAARFETDFVTSANGVGRLFDIASGQLALIGSSTQVRITPNGSSFATAVVGTGAFSGLAKVAFGMNEAGTSAIANAGAKATDITSWGTPSGGTYIGNRAAGDRALNGYVRRATFSPTKDIFEGMTA